MKINEKLYLRKAILQIKRHARENNEAKAFYSKLNTLDIKSLQDLSFNNDLKFFKEINFILSVIISIISHPHISNKGEDIVLRSDQVHSLQNDMFKKTMMDAKLWKHKKNGEMIPEYVHYYQNVDQLNIYENKFIVMLIDLIENELAKFSDFYSTMILSFKDKSLLSLSDDNVQIAFSKIDTITRKIKRIKNTYFYREICKKGRIVLKNITPTNILLKDKLYNYCFKFYKTLITYHDFETLNKDLLIYYYVLLLKDLTNKGFKLSRKNYQDIVINYKGFKFENNLLLMNKDYKVSISFDLDNNGLLLNIINRNIDNYNVTHLLLLDSNINFDKVSEVLNESDISIKNIEVISSMKRGYVVNKKVKKVKQNPLKESELVAQYLDEKMTEIKCSRKIYSTYCPSCKSKTVDLNETDETYCCSTCESIYKFASNEEDDTTLWFIKLRRA